MTNIKVENLEVINRPPVGTICMAHTHGVNNNLPIQVEILKHHTSDVNVAACYWLNAPKASNLLWSNKFYRLPTKKELLLEKLNDLLKQELTEGCSNVMKSIKTILSFKYDNDLKAIRYNSVMKNETNVEKHINVKEPSLFPEGATHYIPESDICYLTYIKLTNNNEVYIWDNDRQWTLVNDNNCRVLILNDALKL